MSCYFDSVAGSWDMNPMVIERATATAGLVKSSPIDERKRLIDFGGGTGLLSLLLKDDFDEITIVDTSEAMLREAHSNICKAKAPNIKTATALPDSMNSHSALVSLMCLHHVQDLESFFAKASCLITEGGGLFIADLYEDDGSYHQHDPDFIGHHGFDVEKLSHMVSKHGFEVVRVNEYFRVLKETPGGKEYVYPLFFLAAIKKR